MKTVNAFVGQPIERLEDLRLVRGRGKYVDDLARKDMLYAAILRSHVAHGRIHNIDISRAQKIPQPLTRERRRVLAGRNKLVFFPHPVVGATVAANSTSADLMSVNEQVF